MKAIRFRDHITAAASALTEGLRAFGTSVTDGLSAIGGQLGHIQGGTLTPDSLAASSSAVDARTLVIQMSDSTDPRVQQLFQLAQSIAGTSLQSRQYV
jgi:hypothetical protein